MMYGDHDPYSYMLFGGECMTDPDMIKVARQMMLIIAILLIMSGMCAAWALVL